MSLIDYSDELTYTVGPPATSKQSIVGAFGTAIVGGRVKDGGGAKDWGAGELIKVLIRVVTAVAGASGGVQFDVVGADNALLTTNPVVLATRTIPTASLLINTLFSIGVIGAGSKKRFLGVKATPLTSNSTTGEVIVWLAPPDSAPQDAANAV